MQEVTERLRTAFQAEFERLIELAPRFTLGLVVMVGFVWVGRLVGRLVSRALVRSQLSHTHRSFFGGLASWAVALVGLAIALNVVGLGALAAGLVTSGGVTAIVLGFAFRQIGENLLAGFFLAFSRPFEVGDYIESEGLAGTVKGIELRSTHMRTADGRDIFIPSAQIFNSPLTNYTRDNLRRPSFRIGVDYRDDLARARELLLETTRAVDGVLQDPPAVVYAAAPESQYVEIEVAFWIDTGASNMARLHGAVLEACVAALAAADFHFSSEIVTGVDVTMSPDSTRGAAATA